uniref:rRNA 2'-O-methyltransferase fibrillarin n=1 Tax=Phlebotomus papatasi TaxID=29031 RepID=A0A1B0D717_PHLPP
MGRPGFTPGGGRGGFRGAGGRGGSGGRGGFGGESLRAVDAEVEAVVASNRAVGEVAAGAEVEEAAEVEVVVVEGVFKGGKTVIIEPHRHEGVFIARGKEDALVTRNLVPGSEVYGEKRISVEVSLYLGIFLRICQCDEKRRGMEFGRNVADRLSSFINMAPELNSLACVFDQIHLGLLVYAVEFSHRSGRDLINVAKKRTNIIPIIEDARHPHKYRMLIGMVDTVFADVAQPDQARIVALNAQHFLKNGGHFVISIKASCIDSTAQPEAVFAAEVKKLQADKLKPQEQITLEPYERDHAVVVGVFRPPPKA